MTDDDRPGSEASDPTERLLAQALHEEAAMVHTDPSGLHEIQRRTASDRSRSRRSWAYAGLGAAAATAAVIAGVAVAANQSPDHDGEGPASGPSSPAVSVATQPTSLWYVGTSTHRLYAETHPAPAGDQAAVMSTLLSTPAADPDYTSGWPTGIQVSGVQPSNGGVDVALTGPAGSPLPADPRLGSTGGMMAIQALLKTGGLPTGETVDFTYNGEQLQTLLGVDLPVKVASEDQTRAWLQITSPAEGETLASPVVVSVAGNVFEGNVTWRLDDAQGTKVDSGYATTSMGSWSDATIKLGTLDPGTYTITCYEVSPANGSIGNVDDKTFTVQ